MEVLYTVENIDVEFLAFLHVLRSLESKNCFLEVGLHIFIYVCASECVEPFDHCFSK